MLVMLLNVKIHVLVKIEILAVSLIPEGLQLGHNGIPGQDNMLSAKEESVQGPVHLLPILGLAEPSHDSTSSISPSKHGGRCKL